MDVARIDPAAIPALFRKIGKKPIRRAWNDEGGCCLLLALAIDRGVPDECLTYSNVNIVGGSVLYAIGLRRGWDGRPRLLEDFGEDDEVKGPSCTKVVRSGAMWCRVVHRVTNDLGSAR